MQLRLYINTTPCGIARFHDLQNGTPMQFPSVNSMKEVSTIALRGGATFFLLCTVLLGGGCASNTIEDAVPQGALGITPATSIQQTSEMPAVPDVQGGQIAETVGNGTGDKAGEYPANMSDGQAFVTAPRPAKSTENQLAATRDQAKGGPKTGKDGYPDLNAVPNTGQAQISATEKAKALSELENARKSQDAASNSASEDEIRRLRQLAESNAEDVLREIEGN
jgi:hypothetical protein